MTTRRSKLGNAPLTDEQLRHLTADQFLEMKLTNEEKARLRVINAQKEQQRIDRSARIQAEEEPILSELRSVGLEVHSVWDLVNTPNPYPEAIAILLRHLLLPYSDVVKDGIARSLAVSEPEVQESWQLLAEEYRKAPAGWGFRAPGDTEKHRLGAKDALACALAASVTDDRLPDLIALAKDRKQGESRGLLLSALRVRLNKSRIANEAIGELASDPELGAEINSWRERNQ